MGIYTNNNAFCYYTPSSDYRDVEPFVGEHFNYHELGIVAAAESVANRNAFMKAIALGELASVEQYGTDEVFYEAVNISSIIDRIKAFFKKLIEKIHKIFHTFIAKMASWFGSTDSFVKKYEKEIINNWDKVKDDWKYKGHKFSNIVMTKKDVDSIETAINGDASDPVIAALKASNDSTTFENELKKWATGGKKTNFQTRDGKLKDNKGNNITMFLYGDQPDPLHSTIKAFKVDKPVITSDNQKLSPKTLYDFSKGNNGQYPSYDESTDGPVVQLTQIDDTNSYNNRNVDISNSDSIAKFRDDFEEKGKDQIRYQMVENLKQGKLILNKIDCSFSASGSLDAKEFTNEIQKAIYGEEKEDLSLKEIEGIYGGSAHSMVAFLKDYKKIKESLEKSEKKLIQTIDNRISAIDKAKDAVHKNEQEAAAGIVQISSVFQSFWGFVKECETQLFSAYLGGVKDACVQAKQISVAVIGLNKKMTEGVDYSINYSNPITNFMESVKFV